FSAEQEQLRESLRRFLADHAPVEYVRALYGDERGFTDEVWRGLVDLGVVGLLVPEAAGGSGRGMVDMAVVLEELGGAVHPGPFTASAVGAVTLINRLDGWTSHPVFADVARGERIGTVALLEPGRRATWSAPTTTAADGTGGWTVTGTKAHVAAARAADVFLVTATTPGDGLGVFAVAAADGTIVPTPTVDGTRSEATVTFAAAPATRVGGGDASAAVAATVDYLGVAAVVDGVGAAQRALELSVDYARERHQFGVPIGSFQAVQHLCADMLRAVELARAAGYYACWAADEADAAERHRAATMALAFAADELAGVGAATIQVHAGIGFTWEHDAHLFYKRLLTLQRVGGGSVDQLQELASIVLP
ncbi:MAG TPA: acyl-CoA dehydrogenase family protein, partial [Acidimicrobiia bacterium]|nr:acyl-CoA dehydrogenase family protein [Acidimicrobiia bacterium]